MFTRKIYLKYQHLANLFIIAYIANIFIMSLLMYLLISYYDIGLEIMVILFLSFPLFIYVYYFYFPYLVLQNFEGEIRNNTQYNILNKLTPTNPFLQFENYSMHFKMDDKNSSPHFIIKYNRIQYPRFSLWYNVHQSRYLIFDVKVDRKIKQEIESSITDEIPEIGNKKNTVFYIENKKGKPLSVRIEIGDYTFSDLMKYIQTLEGYLQSDNRIKRLLSYG